jgi:hypothetical protein
MPIRGSSKSIAIDVEASKGDVGLPETLTT